MIRYLYGMLFTYITMLLLQYNVCITYNVVLILNALRIVESFCTVPQTILNVMFTILIYPNCFIYNIMAQEKKTKAIWQNIMSCLCLCIILP